MIKVMLLIIKFTFLNLKVKSVQEYLLPGVSEFLDIVPQLFDCVVPFLDRRTVTVTARYDASRQRVEVC